MSISNPYNVRQKYGRPLISDPNKVNRANEKAGKILRHRKQDAIDPHTREGGRRINNKQLFLDTM